MLLTGHCVTVAVLSSSKAHTWLTNHRPSVLCHCWFGHLTRKIVSEMTYNVSSGTLNTTIPYDTKAHTRYVCPVRDPRYSWLAIPAKYAMVTDVGLSSVRPSSVCCSFSET